MTIETDISNIANGGDGVGEMPDGRVLFVPRTLPGEAVEVEVTRSKSSYAFGDLVAIKRSSGMRVDPECAHFERCGGCQLRHAARDRQLELKAKGAIEAMRRISGLDARIPDPELVRSPRMDMWRARATLRARYMDGGLHMGYFESRTKRLVPVEACPVLREPLEIARRTLHEVLASKVRQAEIFMETAGAGQTVVTLSNLQLKGRFNTFVNYLKNLLFTEESAGSRLIRGVIIEGGEQRIELGRPEIDVGIAIAGVDPAHSRQPIPAGLFRQANPELNLELVKHVTEQVTQGQPRTVLELFAGCGNFTLSVARGLKRGRMLAIEGSPEAVEVGTHLMGLHGAFGGRVTYMEADLSKEHWAATSSVAESEWPVVLLDPPRRGAMKAVEIISRWESTERIVYVSCDPACLARDLEEMAKVGWKVRDLRFFDMFPQTAHIEAVAVCER